MNYIFLDNGFEEIEAITTIDILRRAEIPVCIVSMTGTLDVVGAHNIGVRGEKRYEDVDFSDAQTLILPGGQIKYIEHPDFCELVKKHNDENKLIAAICAAPSFLGQLGILQDKQATCYPGFEEALGDSYIGGLVVVSKNIITAKGPGLSSDFAFSLVEHLVGCEKADEVYDAAQY